MLSKGLYSLSSVTGIPLSLTIPLSIVLATWI